MKNAKAKRMNEAFKLLEPDQRTHTQGEWIANGINGIHTPNGRSIATTSCYLGEDAEEGKLIAEANAQRIVKAVNMHDELIRTLKAWINCNGDTEWARHKRSSRENEVYDKTVSILKQAEQE